HTCRVSCRVACRVVSCCVCVCVCVCWLGDPRKSWVGWGAAEADPGAGGGDEGAQDDGHVGGHQLGVRTAHDHAAGHHAVLQHVGPKLLRPEHPIETHHLIYGTYIEHMHM